MEYYRPDSRVVGVQLLLLLFKHRIDDLDRQSKKLGCRCMFHGNQEALNQNKIDHSSLRLFLHMIHILLGQLHAVSFSPFFFHHAWLASWNGKQERTNQVVQRETLVVQQFTYMLTKWRLLLLETGKRTRANLAVLFCFVQCHGPFDNYQRTTASDSAFFKQLCRLQQPDSSRSMAVFVSYGLNL